MKKIICLIMSCAICLFMSVIYTYSVSEDLRQNIVRLHIVANSNSEYDQAVKYRVRDTFIENSDTLLKNDFSTEYMKTLANETLTECGAAYSARCATGDFYFPKKHYKNISTPEGTYHGVKIILGDGIGENWWCVLSPPLCFSESSLGISPSLEGRLNSDTIDVITDADGINIRFALVELVKKFI